LSPSDYLYYSAMCPLRTCLSPVFFFQSSAPPRVPHSFPNTTLFRSTSSPPAPPATAARATRCPATRACRRAASRARPTPRCSSRSEEHTSELQSHLNLVCRLLLEKKKKKQTDNNTMTRKLEHTQPPH